MASSCFFGYGSQRKAAKRFRKFLGYLFKSEVSMGREIRRSSCRARMTLLVAIAIFTSASSFLAGRPFHYLQIVGGQAALKAEHMNFAAMQTTTKLGGTSWQLVKFQGSNGETLMPDDRAKYTIAFASDGRVTARNTHPPNYTNPKTQSYTKCSSSYFV